MATITDTLDNSPSASTVRWPARLLLFSVFLLLSGALQRPLGGDVIEGTIAGGYTRGQNTPIIVLGILIYTAAAASLLLGKKRIRISKLLSWIFLLNILALLSGVWSASLNQTLIRGLGLTGATICALYAYSVFSLREFLRDLSYFSAIFILGEAAVSVLSPTYAYHSSNEFYSYAAGLLKGTFIHKNDMAKTLSLFLIVLVTFGKDTIKNKYYHWASLIVGFYLLAQTGSAKTFASIPASLLVGYFLATIHKPARRLAFIAYISIGWLLLDASGLLDYLFSLALTSLDRDPTLSGRTVIWDTAIQTAIANNFTWIGGGYQTAWGSGIGDAVRAITGSDPGHPHNGFINTFIELGIVGLGLLLAHFATIAKTLVFFPGNPNNVQFFLFAWMALLITNNLGGTYMMLPGDIYWFFLVLTPVMLAWTQRTNAIPSSVNDFSSVAARRSSSVAIEGPRNGLL